MKPQQVKIVLSLIFYTFLKFSLVKLNLKCVLCVIEQTIKKT